MEICTISGGKDSQATAIFLIKSGLKNIQYVFCDTGWEDDDTYKFIDDFEIKLKTKIKRLIPELDFVQLAKKKKRFPSTMVRFCTQELKVKPMIDFILEQKESLTIYQGMRWAESTNRSGLEKQDEFFRYYFEPYKITDKGEKKYFTYRKKEIKEWLETYEAKVVRPIISWTTTQVFNYIIDNGFLPNKLYQYGFLRVGCFPCINCNLGEVAKIQEYRPEKIKYIMELEEEMNSTFFPPDYIPLKFCSKKIWKTNKQTGEKKQVGIPSMKDVLYYVNLKGYGSGLFTGSMCQNQLIPCE